MIQATATERRMLRECLSLTRASEDAIDTVMGRMTTLDAIAHLAEFLLAHPRAAEGEILSVACEG